MINVKKLNPKIRVDMRYATPNNFTHAVLYDAAVCLLNEPAAKRLARVQAKLQKQGLGLKVWDCYRPLSVQQKLWEIVPDERYVANPKSGSRHNRGASVDLTLVDASGNELLMPTRFDDFTEKASRDFMDLPAEAIKNRKKLQDAMESEGFIGLPTEWWHFDDPEWQSYALRNEPLSSRSLLKDKMTPGTSSYQLPDNASQIILVVADSWDATLADLALFEKVRGEWTLKEKTWTVSLGTKGMAWGQGLNPVQTTGPQKKEGDLKSTAGIFSVGMAYGYANRAPAGSRWRYQKVDETWRCVDDPASDSYNQIQSVAADAPADWKSAEMMKREDHLYKWVINIEQNSSPMVRGCGSCIFLHVWRKPNSATEGCTAMPEENMVKLLRWLDPAKHPVIIQLPKEEYKRLKKEWGLP